MKADLYLVDTSAWLEVLRPGSVVPGLVERVDTLLAADAVATAGVVRLELLGGTRTESEYRRLQELLWALHVLPTEEDRWTEAALLGFQLRREGITMPFTDLLIAAVSTHYEAALVHRDRHFDLIARRYPLKVESYVGA